MTVPVSISALNRIASILAFFFQAEDGIRDGRVTGVQTCALPISEAEQAVKTSQATIKAAQRLSSSVEWRAALDGVLDAASELVRFERGTLALVDELQEELKVEAARNSPIAISEMSRFKVGEGIAGW